MRLRPSPSSWIAGRWVWPWIMRSTPWRANQSCTVSVPRRRWFPPFPSPPARRSAPGWPRAPVRRTPAAPPAAAPGTAPATAGCGSARELLVGGVVGAQQVAVQQQGGGAVQVDGGGVVEQGHAAACGVGITQQEVAVATDEVGRHTRGSEFAQLVGNEDAGLGRIVVAHPGFEQVAEDVERVGPARFTVEEATEQRGDVRAFRVEVQIGDEERCHAGIVGWRGHRAGRSAG